MKLRVSKKDILIFIKKYLGIGVAILALHETGHYVAQYVLNLPLCWPELGLNGITTSACINMSSLPPNELLILYSAGFVASLVPFVYILKWMTPQIEIDKRYKKKIGLLVVLFYILWCVAIAGSDITNIFRLFLPDSYL